MPLTEKEVQRLELIQRVFDGAMTLREASAQLGISYRQAKRLKKAVASKGAEGVLHGNAGKISKKALDPLLRDRIIHLAGTLYRDLNIMHLAERLCEEQHIAVSRETVRKILKSAGIQVSTSRRSRRVKPFLMASREGTIVLWGGLTSAWFPQPHPECCFMAAVDAATLKCLTARFFPEESTEGYFWLLKKLLSQFGIPGALCQHSRRAVKSAGAKWTIAEELRGERFLGQVARAINSLGILTHHETRRHVKHIVMNLRRLLLQEITRAGVTSLIEGNLFLEHEFLFAYNRRHAFSDEGLRKAWREVPPAMSVDRICSHYYEATVDSFNRVRVEDVEIEIPPGADRISYAMARVEVRRHLNGIWHVYYKNRLIARYVPQSFRNIDLELSKYFWPFKVSPDRLGWLNKMYTNLATDHAYRHV